MRLPCVQSASSRAKVPETRCFGSFPACVSNLMTRWGSQVRALYRPMNLIHAGRDGRVTRLAWGRDFRKPGFAPSGTELLSDAASWDDQSRSNLNITWIKVTPIRSSGPSTVPSVRSGTTATPSVLSNVSTLISWRVTSVPWRRSRYATTGDGKAYLCRGGWEQLGGEEGAWATDGSNLTTAMNVLGAANTTGNFNAVPTRAGTPMHVPSATSQCAAALGNGVRFGPSG
jgi:hypothetical protein